MMRGRWLWSVVAFVATTALGLGKGAAAQPLNPKFKVSLGYHFSSGTYGTSDTTDIAYIPLVAKAEVGPWSIQGTIPYLRINGPAGFIQGPSGPIQTTGGQSDGLGDILLRGSYTIDPDAYWIPFVELVGITKFPTASRGAGLGTGEFDFGMETNLFWSAGKFTPFAMIGYRFLGSPPGTDLDNVVVASLGGLYQLIDKVHVGVFLDYRESPSASVGERLEVVPFGSWQIDAHWSVDLYASAGFTKGSPDAGTGLQLAYTW